MEQKLRRRAIEDLPTELGRASRHDVVIASGNGPSSDDSTEDGAVPWQGGLARLPGGWTSRLIDETLPHAFKKTTRATPQRHIDLALKRLKETTP